MNFNLIAGNIDSIVPPAMLDQINAICGRRMRLEGWCTPRKGHVLAALVLHLKPEFTVEIGVFGGKSFFPMVIAHNELGSGRILGVDPWEKASSVEDMPEVHAEWWGKLNHETIFAGFNRAAKSLGFPLRTRNASGHEIHLEYGPPNVVPPSFEILRLRSDKVDWDALPTPNLLHIDGNHGDAASVWEVKNVAGRMAVGGVVVMDDIHWAAVATELLPQLGFRELGCETGDNDDWAVFEREVAS